MRESLLDQAQKNNNVLSLIKKMVSLSKSKSKIKIIANKKYKANQLNLDAKKITTLTKWKKVLNLNETLKLIVEWNNTYVNNYKQLTKLA